ncbi:MAG: TIGR02301 family protein [Devosia sp.]|uniref:TIGR02301 family protein n=1 Tax=Devosia sp. TaxID=1871048 RepID=UPI0024CDD3D9|nr:TIGR02301 family protein [Devosia sp.]UYN99597.1 MAG: TIGR02301 family protein [Devosia sp.]
MVSTDHKAQPSLTRPVQMRTGAALRLCGLLLLPIFFATPSFAIDPLYQRQMERLSEIMGSLYYLQPLCQAGNEDWRVQMAELIALDEPDEDRRQRLAGAFNGGYTAFSRFHKSCTPSSREALVRLLGEAQRLAREIHTRFAE